MPKLSAKALRSKSPEDLIKLLDEHRDELSKLRVAQVTSSNQSKLSKIREERRDIARILTVINLNNKDAAKHEFRKAKFKNLDLRAKKTRAIRRKLSRDQLTVRVRGQPKSEKSGKASQKRVLKAPLRVLKRNANFPPRKYAVKSQ